MEGIFLQPPHFQLPHFQLQDRLHSLMSSDAIWHYRIWPTLAQVIIYCLFSAKPLPETMLSTGPFEINLIEICIQIWKFSLKKMQYKILSATWRPFCSGLNVFKLQLPNTGNYDTEATTLNSLSKEDFCTYDSIPRLSGQLCNLQSGPLVYTFRLSQHDKVRKCKHGHAFHGKNITSK